MAVRPIIRMGHPTLRRAARRLSAAELAGAAVQTLVRDMVDTLHSAGGIGLAAPQIDEPVRLAIIEIDGGPSRYGDIPTLPLTVFANPEIEVLDPSPQGCWEGCLSVPGLRGYVERPRRVAVHAQGLDGEGFDLELDGFLATVFQHEFDHLDGRLYVDLIQDPEKLVYEQEFNRYIAPQLEPEQESA